MYKVQQCWQQSQASPARLAAPWQSSPASWHQQSSPARLAAIGSQVQPAGTSRIKSSSVGSHWQSSPASWHQSNQVQLGWQPLAVKSSQLAPVESSPAWLAAKLQSSPASWHQSNQVQPYQSRKRLVRRKVSCAAHPTSHHGILKFVAPCGFKDVGLRIQFRVALRIWSTVPTRSCETACIGGRGGKRLFLRMPYSK